MPWHHIIPKHEWERRFGNLSGVDADDNLVNLTTEQHSQVHELLGMRGSRYDEIASLAIRSMIGKEEAQKLAASFASSISNKGNTFALGVKRTEAQKRLLSERARNQKQTAEQRKKVAERMIGNTFSYGKKNGLGHKHTDKYKKETSVRMIGNTNALGSKHSKEINQCKSERQIGKKRGPYRKIHTPIV